MARNLCLSCQRPVKACICAFFCEINNEIPVLVLQHPSEVKQSKGTVALLQHSLNFCQVIVGENFTEHTGLNEILTQHQVLLLYPGEQAVDVSLVASFFTQKGKIIEKQKPPLLIMLDGTWKKTYRMFMLSKNLHSLSQVCLPDFLANNGQYLIRKVAKNNALSSLEAVCYALALLEGELTENGITKKRAVATKPSINCGRYQPLLDQFSQFNQFQLAFIKASLDENKKAWFCN
ncbi:MAG: DTW domain-containing protein [Colwellia sp.]|nr:DTW domain-containing protein [Colwellia sp.]